MNAIVEKTDEALGASVKASLLGTVRHAVFAVAMAVAMDAFEADSEAATAGELWLEVHNRMTVAAQDLA